MDAGDDARTMGRRVRQIRQAERDALVRDVLAEMLTHTRRDAVGRELRGMAYRAGLPA